MRVLLKLVKLEFCKLRRKKLIWLMLLSAFVMPFFAFLYFGYLGQTNIDPTVEVNGKEINLTQLEFDILEVFMKHRNQVLTRDNLINQVWGYDFTGDEKAVNIHVMNLRRKLDIDCIQTVRGVGYKFESED